MVREMDFVDECYADKDLSLLKKLTLVIPTYNRNYYLSRCLWYHAHFQFGQIIVADSSSEEKKVVNRETVAKVREMFGVNILYLEYEPETEKYGGDIYRKWGDAVMHVETEYSQICTDKEFLIPSTLCSAAMYLEENLEYIATSGNLLHYVIGEDNSDIVYCQCPMWHSIDSEDDMVRFQSAIKTGWQQTLLFSLYRRKIHQNIFQPIIRNSISDIRFGERYLGFAGYSYGKVKHLDNMNHNVRDVSEISRSKNKKICESSALRYPQVIEYKKLGVFSELYAGYQEALFSLFKTTSEKDITTIYVNYKKYIKPIVTRDALSYPNYLYLIRRKIPRLAILLSQIIADKSYNYSNSKEIIPILHLIMKTKSAYNNDSIISMLE